MKYTTTRCDTQSVTDTQAIVNGLARDGGLYVPESFPELTYDKITALKSISYSRRASEIIGLFLETFEKSELQGYAEDAYNMQTFDTEAVAPLHKTDNKTHFLELWHGPTAAFKDMALQIMPKLLTASLKKEGEQREVCILVATSGDTGKAALEGFRDVPGTRILVFYPKDGVSDIQRLQMTTQRGGNVCVAAVTGNFDDTQSGVKEIFSDNSFISELGKRGYLLSSANSINWGRLVPQIAYYVSAYCDLLNSGEISDGDRINFCVPTGNFGNILAGYYARKIGLPINKLICASNRNDVLTQFINTGVYDKNRAFYTTISPSMDILISGNLERLLFEMSDKDGSVVDAYMSALKNDGRYTVPADVLKSIREDFACAYCSEEDTKKTIAGVYRDFNYLIDTHTAVAYKALQDYRLSSGDNTLSVVISTASPYKFCHSVLDALGKTASADGAALIDELYNYTLCKVPAPLVGFEKLEERFNTAIGKDDMKQTVINFL